MPIINSVITQGGVTPTGTLNITSNGTRDVTNYAEVDVAVPTTAPESYIGLSQSDGNLINDRTSSFTVNLTGVTTINGNSPVFMNAFRNNSSITGEIDCSSITSINSTVVFKNAFYFATGITKVDFSGLTTVTGADCFNSAFRYMTNCLSLDFSNLTTINGNYCFCYLCYNTEPQRYPVALKTVDFSSLTSITGDNCFLYAFSGAHNLETLNFSSLSTISGSNIFDHAFVGTKITSFFMPSLTSISSQRAFQECFSGNTNLTSVDFSGLTSITGSNAFEQAFVRCTNLTNVNVKSLETISNYSGIGAYIFGYCSSLTTFKFESLQTVGKGSFFAMFYQSGLQNLYFYALNPSSFGSYTNQFNFMLGGVSGCTVHFPMAIQSTIGSWSDVTNGFGGTNTTVLFDIVTSLTGADSNTYTRKQKESTSTATAWTYNSALYYTSGTTEPAVGDTIYSDAACTTAVTTISSIA